MLYDLTDRKYMIVCVEGMVCLIYTILFYTELYYIILYSIV